MNGWAAVVMLLVLAMPAQAIILESGDGGAEFAAKLSVEKCREDGTKEVYICTGNAVKVISSVEGKGSTFYKPDGRVISCPDVAPTEMGGECIQMFTPNYCPEEPLCAVSAKQSSPEPATEVEPEPLQEQATTETGDSDETTVSEPEKTTEKKKNTSETETGREMDIPTAQNAVFDQALDNLSLIVILLGVVALALLFTMFKNSISE